jgi:hypothetical protein
MDCFSTMSSCPGSWKYGADFWSNFTAGADHFKAGSAGWFDSLTIKIQEITDHAEP